jgi:Ca2+-binding RTX toxin-like protein
MANRFWSAITNGQNIVFNKTADVLNFDNNAISAANTLVSFGTGTKVTFTNTVNGVKKEFSLDIGSGNGKLITTTNVVFQDGSKLFIGDNTTGTSADNGANSFLGVNGGTAKNDRFLPLGGNDSMDGKGGDDVFVLNNGAANFGADSLIGGAGNDWMGVGFALNTPSGSTVNWNTGTLTTFTNYGSATFTGIENAFGTIHGDSFFAGELARTVNGYQTSGGIGATPDFVRTMEGYSGNDFFRGDTRDGYSEMVTYRGAPSGVYVDLSTGEGKDGYDSDAGTAGFQSFTDTLAGIDFVQGSMFNDTLKGGGISTTFSGGYFESFEGMAGNDTISSNSNNFVRADYQNSPNAVNVDLAKGTAKDGWDSNATMAGFQVGTDTLFGIGIVRGSNFNDTMVGNAFGNQFEGRAGNDSIDGGDGLDMVVFQNATAGITATLANSGATTLNLVNAGLGTDTIVGIEGLRGGDYADKLTGNSGANQLEGRAGNDTLNGKDGGDQVRYDASFAAVTVTLGEGTLAGSALDGHDSNFAEEGVQSFTDTLLNIEAVRGSKFGDSITGNSGDNFIEGYAGDDTLDGGADGIDWLEFLTSPDGVTASLTEVSDDGWGGQDVVSGFENFRGSNFDDSLTGDFGGNIFAAGTGADTMAGGLGMDTYEVDDVDDEVIDVVEEGIVDTVKASISYRITDENVEDLYLLGTGNLSGRGNAAANYIQGTSGNNRLRGEGGDDSLDGMSGNDTLDGGDGADELDGGSGNDRFVWDINDLLVDGGDVAGNKWLHDRIVVKGGENALDFSSSAEAGPEIVGIDELDLRGSGDNSLVADAPTLLDITGGRYFVVMGNAGDALTLVDNAAEGETPEGIWSQTADDVMHAGRLVDSYQSSIFGFRVFVDSAVEVTIVPIVT